jgi:hypothetical protein
MLQTVPAEEHCSCPCLGPQSFVLPFPGILSDSKAGAWIRQPEAVSPEAVVVLVGEADRV